MTLKTWVLGRVHRGGSLLGRGDLPRREPSAPASIEPAGGPPSRSHDSALADMAHLGPYSALIGAIRDELEHFVADHLRLHLAIADHDRFLLTAIHISCAEGSDARPLLHQFMREFKPEQVKRYLVREIIAALPNAAAIDLSQFASLRDADTPRDTTDDDEYAELLAALRGPAAAPATHAFQVNIVGRWTERDSSAARPASTTSLSPVSTPATPMAGQRCEFDVDDAEGKRRVVLHGVVPGRRYVIGKDAGCDIRVNGAYTSRRHGELWLEHGAWHITDAGSTNGIRVESTSGSVERSGPAAGNARTSAIKLSGGERIVLSANAEGTAADYPAIALRAPAAEHATRVTPIAGALPASATQQTPLTPIRSAHAWRLTVRGAGGVHGLDLVPEALPVTIGRSRSQTLVIARAHELVSGHHLDIVGVDASGAQVLVHGDNGVVVDGVTHALGARFLWRPGETMVLGAVNGDGRACTLTLAQRD